MNKENFIADDTFTSECEELLKDLNVNIGGNYRVANIDFQIADTLEKIQHINPEVYGLWYSKLYPPHGDINNWTMETLAQLNDIVK
jgi:hypothetical protein